jgi:hypothetical protein
MYRRDEAQRPKYARVRGGPRESSEGARRVHLPQRVRREGRKRGWWHSCSEAGILDRFWLEFSAVIPRLGGAESNEGIEIFGRPEGVHS